MTAEKMNPVRADFDDLLSLKKRVVAPMPKTNRAAYIGFGDTKSPFKTKGLDFQEVRAYQPGDDIRLIDWRVTAKYGKPFTKLYTDEKDRQVYFICDMRTRMKFASDGAFKSVWAARIAVFLAYMAQNKGDKTAYTILSSDKIETAGSERGDNAVLSLIKTVEKASNPQKTDTDIVSLEQALYESQDRIRAGGIVFILSDFADWNNQCEAIVARWSGKNTIALIQIYDKLEEELPAGVFPISNGYDISFLNTEKNTFKHTYQQAFEEINQKLSTVVQTYQLGFLSVRTDWDNLTLVDAYCRGGGV